MTREEAIERIKTRFDKWALDNEDMKAIQAIVPELAESEDERIRKGLLKTFKNAQFGEWGKLKIKDIIAWLEKQKEQMPVMIQWTGKNLKEVIDFTGKSPKFGEWFKSWGEFEEYVHSHNDILKLFCEDGSHYEVPVGAWIVKTPDGYNIPSRFRLIQKSTEWSEEDEKIIYGLIRGLKAKRDVFHHTTFSNDEIDITKAIVWLKSLCPQPHWKPSEEQMPLAWSEEDEKTRVNLMSLLADLQVGGKIREDTYQKYYTWLKSIRGKIVKEDEK